MLKDGADSVGALGALNRVFINIGTFSEEWLQHFNALLGGKRVSPIRIADARGPIPRISRPPRRRRSTSRGSSCARPARIISPMRRAVPPICRPTSRCSRAARWCSRRPARAATRARPCRRRRPGLDPNGCNGKDYLVLLEPVLGVDADGAVQGSRCARSSWPRTSSTTTTCRPSSACRSRCCGPTRAARSPPTRFATTSGTTSRRESYKSLPSVGEITWYHPYTGEAADLSDAGRRARLHAAAIAHQPVVDRAIPVEQQRRPLRVESLGRGADARVPGWHRADAVAGETRAGLAARRPASRA